MINWNTDEDAFKKKSPKQYALWRLVQLINYGLEGEKLDPREVKLAWPKIKDRRGDNKNFYLSGGTAVFPAGLALFLAGIRPTKPLPFPPSRL